MQSKLGHLLMSYYRRAVAWRWLAAAAICCACAPVHAHWHDDVGYTALENLLGDNLPTGEGIFVSQVEASPESNPSRFVPDPNHTQLSGVTFVNGSTHANPLVANHATNVARSFYGSVNGLARDSNTVVMYELGDYVTSFLNGANALPPDAPSFTDPADGQVKQYKVQNHSWSGTYGEVADRYYLRKMDYLIDQYELTMVVGVSDNGTVEAPHPPQSPLAGQSYNAIVVGRSDGLHSVQTTTLADYGPGRRRPLIVVGGSGINTVSGATPAVSGAVAMFHELMAGTDATRTEAMRAILLAGATKDKFLSYVDPGTGNVDSWQRTSSTPLDNIFGAGEMNVYNSYLITQGGQFSGSTGAPTPVEYFGWDYNTVNSGGANTRKYQLEIPAGTTATEFSVILTWNVATDSNFNGQDLENLTLRLRDGLGNVVDESTSGGAGATCTSNCDNVEHIYVGPGQLIGELGPGTYTLEVSTTGTRDYGIAWRTATQFDTPSADFDEDSDVDGVDFLAWQQGLGKFMLADHADGDADGDGDVDAVDLSIFETQYGTQSLPPLAGINAVPEPHVVGLLAVSGLICALTVRQRRGV